MVANPPSPFYRVALKVIILDDQGRMLVLQNGHDRDLWEIPGGGWEHGEDIEACLKRELLEEAGMDIVLDAPDRPRFVFQAPSVRWGYQGLRIVYDAHVVDLRQLLTPGDGMIAARFVTKDELMALPFASLDEPIKQFVDSIWPPKRDSH